MRLLKVFYRRTLGLVICICLIASADGIIVPSLAKAEDPGPFPVPPIVSPPTQRIPQPITGDFSYPQPSPQTSFTPNSPPPPPERTDPIKGYVEGVSKELIQERTATAKIFSNPDGTRTAFMYGSPVHYQDATGAWKGIDTNLLPDVDGFRNGGGLLNVHFALAADSQDLATISTPAGSVSFSMQGASPALGVTDGSQITYPLVAPGVDLQYQVSKTIVKELVILHEAPSEGSTTSFSFLLNPGSLLPRQEEDGSIGLYDSQGNKQLFIPPATMWDSNIDPKSADPAYGPAHLSLAQQDDQWVVALEGDQTWLSDPSRKYPVYLDPSIGYFGAPTSGGFDTFGANGYPNNNYNVYKPSTTYEDRVGYYDGNWGTSHTFLYYELSPVLWKDIISAHWNGYWSHSYYVSTPTDFWLHPVAGGWSSTTLTWNNQPSVAADIATGSGVRNSWSNVEIGAWVYYWTHGIWGNAGIRIDTDTNNHGTDTTYYKKLTADENPTNVSYIEVTYNSYPTVSGVSPADGTGAPSLTPTLVVSGSDADGDTLQYQYWICEDPNDASCWASNWTNATSFTVPSGILTNGRTYYWHARVFDGLDFGDPTWRWSYTAINGPPPAPSLSAPDDQAVVATTAPTFSVGQVADPEGDPVSYQFYVATGSDAKSGLVTRSGWISAASWNPPVGSLVDGVKYYWTAETKDSNTANASLGAVRSFKVDLGLGNQHYRSYDSVGPVSVGLSNGNAIVATSSPTFNALGGKLGISYTYNSQTPPIAGLRGYYFNDYNQNRIFDSSEPAVVVRTDPQVNFNWGGGSPYPSVNADQFLARWVGYVTVPAAGSYYFGSISDDGMRVWIDNNLVSDQWRDQAPPASAQFGSPVTLAKLQTVPIKIEFYENAWGAVAQLWVKGPIGTGGAQGEAIVPSDWLTTELPGLPDGWSLSADPDGNLGYSYAKIGSTSVVLTDSTGATHSYNWTGSGWDPPPGEDGVLATDAATGLLALKAEDGRAYGFNADGTLNNVTSPLDDRAPAALSYTWSGTPARLTKITDPVSGRSINLTYALPNSTACPTGATPAPSYMLCKLDYSEFAGGQTNLYYSNGHLAQIADPGNELTDFGYDSSGRLTQIRDPLNNDLIACGPIVCQSFTDPASDIHKTLIVYDTSNRVTSVTLPIPDSSGASRPAHSYDYSTPGATLVHVAGLPSGPGGYARRVAYESGGRMTEERDLAGKVTSYVWDSENRLVKTTDPVGLVQTTLYDPAGRPTDAYGPGTANEFAVTSTAIPHSITGYDEGITKLATTWWENPSLVGPPKTRTTTGLQNDWGTAAPAGLSVSDNVSARFTGEINLSQTGSYGFSAETGADDGVRMYLDDRLVINRWDTYRAAVLKDSPVAYWRLGDTSGTQARDETSNAYHGTYLNGVVLNKTGALNNDSNTASGFDGANDKVASPSRTRPANNFAFEAWVKPTTTHEVDPESLAPANGITGQRYAFAPDHMGSEAGAGVSVGTNGVSVYEHGDAYMPAIAVYQGKITGWAHLVVNYVDRQPRIYLNGELVRTGQTSARSTVRAPLDVGSYDYGSFPGDMDEVAFYSTSLTEERIRAHFEAGRAKFFGTSNLEPYADALLRNHPLAYWRLGEASGSVATDASPNANNATYTNGVGLGIPGALQADTNTASRFDGIDDRMNSSLSRPENSFTMEAWVRPTTTHELDSEGTTGTSGTSGERYLFAPDNMGGDAGAGVSVGTNGISVYEHGSDYMPAISVYPGNVTGWNHIVVVYQNKQPTIYLNGQWVKTGQVSPKPTVYGPTDVGAFVYGKFQGDTDEVAIYDYPLDGADVAVHYAAGRSKYPQPIRSVAAGAHRIRIDYKDPTADAKLKISWTPPGSSSALIPDSSLKPRYNLVTSSTDPDGKKVATEYAAPELGLATASILDPQGLALRSTTSYEPVGAGKFYRRTSRTLPAGASTAVSYSYFGATETADNPCTAPVEAINQAGALKTATDADPDGAGSQASIVRESRYDEAGRVVASRVIGDANWACTTYDSRGRVTSQKDSSGKTSTFDYSNPAQVTTSYTDSAGTARTTVSKTDWLGRGLTYTDENATITRTAYDQAGRVIATYRTFSGQSESQLTGLSYDPSTGRLSSLSDHLATGPGTQPDSLSGLKLWLRADGMSGLSDGDSVATWTDSSGQGNNAAQATATKKPTYRTNVINSKPVVRFDGGDVLKITNSAIFPDPQSTMIVVASGKKPPSGVFLIDSATDNQVSRRYIQFTSSGLLTGRDGGGGTITNGGYTNDSFSAFTVVQNGASSSVSVNGASPVTGTISTSSAPSITPTTIGGRYTEDSSFVTTDIAEVIIYNRAVSDEERAQLNAYLGSKYGIAVGSVGRVTLFSYDDAGRLTSTTRPNGVTTTNAFDSSRGWLNSISNTKDATELSLWTYTRNPSGDIASEVTTGRTRNFTYDAAGRLTRTVEGATTRNYSFDQNSNRCSTSTSCDGSYQYDNADRLLSSPFATGYQYDSHGNLTSADPITQPPTGSLNQSFSFDAATSTAPQEYPVVVGQNGTLSTTLDWTPTTYRTGNPTGSIAPGATATSTVSVAGSSNFASSLTWTQGSRPTSTAFSSSVPWAGTTSHSISPTATGNISASLDWPQAPIYTSATGSGNIPASGSWTTPVVLRGQSYVSASLTWIQGGSGYANLTLNLKNPSGSVVKTVSGSGGGPISLSYLAAAPGGTYTLEIQNNSSSTNVPAFSLPYSATTVSTQSLSGLLTPGQTSTQSLTADAQGKIYSSLSWIQGSKSQSGSFSGSVPTSGNATHTVTATATGTISASLDWAGTSVPLSESGTVGILSPQTHPFTVTSNGTISATLAWSSQTPNPNLDLELIDTFGNTVDSSKDLTGNEETLSYEVTDLSSPGSRTYAWKVTDLGLDSTYTLSGFYPATTNLDLELYNSSNTKVASSYSTTAKPETLTYTVASGSTGAYTLKVISADYDANYTLGTSYPISAYAGITMNLKNPSGSTVKTASGSTGSLDMDYLAPDPGGAYTLEIQDTSTDLAVPSYSGTAASPQRRYPDLDLELWSPSNVKVASSYSTTARPETISYSNAVPGTYTLKAISKDYDSSYTLNANYKLAATANLTFRLKNPSGSTVATTTSSTGSASLAYLTPSGGGYTLEIANNSTDTDVPSYSESWSLTSTMTIALKDSTGAVIQQDTSGAKPKTITRAMTPGSYKISATPTGGAGTATVTASYPGRPLREVIGYDANDHATSVDDGTNTVAETLSPSGRVLRRVVTDDATGQVSEDTTFGYDDDGDSPAYSKPTAGGAVTTYIEGGGGILAIDVGGTAVYPITNAHGDIVGTTDAAGTPFIANPVTDEFGVGEPPANRLGWLGAKERFSTGGSLGLIRMGVRIYDPALGRFLSVDPVEGGSANDYDYAYQDPVNNLDLDGRFSCKWCGKAWRKAGRIVRSKDFWLAAAGFAASVAVSVGTVALIAGTGGLGAVALVGGGMLLRSGAATVSIARAGLAHQRGQLSRRGFYASLASNVGGIAATAFGPTAWWSTAFSGAQVVQAAWSA